MKLLHLKSKRIVLAKTDEGYKAFDDHCPHKGGSLAGGIVSCNTVTCPWHGSQFSVIDGQLKSGPSKEGIRTYGVSEANGKIFLTLA
jgi:nitrite reductase/ring-hydroxylating ferredoxin subunit